MTLGTFFLDIVNTYKGMRLESATLSDNYVYLTLISHDGTEKFDFSIHKSEVEKND